MELHVGPKSHNIHDPQYSCHNLEVIYQDALLFVSSSAMYLYHPIGSFMLQLPVFYQGGQMLHRTNKLVH